MNRWEKSDRKCRFGGIIVWTAISLVVLIGFAALAVDLGYVRVAKAQLQNAADSSALAGVSAFKVQPGVVVTLESLARDARERSTTYGAKNVAAGKSLLINPADIEVGYIRHSTVLGEALAVGSTPYNAVRVTVRRDNSNNTYSNGPVELFFAQIWGKGSMSITAKATAYIDKPAVPALPLACSKAAWDDLIVNGNGTDNWGYDAEADQVLHSGDGVKELILYPLKVKAGPGDEGAGNYGILNFGLNNLGAVEIEAQIRDGLTDQQLLAGIGPGGQLPMTFADANSYSINGNTGRSSDLQRVLESRIGDVVGIFTYSQVDNNGSPTLFTVTGIEYVRILDVNLHGANPQVIVQSVGYNDPASKERIQLIR